MGRRALTSLMYLSPLLCVAAIVLWVRSYLVGDNLRFIRSTSTDADFTRRDTSIRVGRGFASIVTSVSTTTHRDMVAHNMRPHNFNDVTEWTLDKPAHRVTEAWFSNQSRNPDKKHSGFSVLGFSVHRAAAANGLVGTDIIVPLWLVVLLSLMLPALWMRRLRRESARKRRRMNQCIACGYSLMGNTSGTCPECGSPITQKAEAAT